MRDTKTRRWGLFAPTLQRLLSFFGSPRQKVLFNSGPRQPWGSSRPRGQRERPRRDLMAVALWHIIPLPGHGSTVECICACPCEISNIGKLEILRAARHAGTRHILYFDFLTLRHDQCKRSDRIEKKNTRYFRRSSGSVSRAGELIRFETKTGSLRGPV